MIIVIVVRNNKRMIRSTVWRDENGMIDTERDVVMNLTTIIIINIIFF